MSKYTLLHRVNDNDPSGMQKDEGILTKKRKRTDVYMLLHTERKTNIITPLHSQDKPTQPSIHLQSSPQVDSPPQTQHQQVSVAPFPPLYHS